MPEQVADAVAGIMRKIAAFGNARARSHFSDPDWNGDREAERTKRAIESAITAIVRERDLMRLAVKVADMSVLWLDSALRKNGVEVVDYLNAIGDYARQRDAATAPPDGEQERGA